MTLFEKILSGEIPADILYRDEQVFAIRDINPQAPTHILVIPVKPVPRLGEAGVPEAALMGHLLMTAAHLARELGLDEGYRIVINNGPHGGESVPHLHVHLLGGRPLTWPPG
jgi:histidine triad (HIT) family protein